MNDTPAPPEKPKTSADAPNANISDAPPPASTQPGRATLTAPPRPESVGGVSGKDETSRVATETNRSEGPTAHPEFGGMSGKRQSTEIGTEPNHSEMPKAADPPADDRSTFRKVTEKAAAVAITTFVETFLGPTGSASPVENAEHAAKAPERPSTGEILVDIAASKLPIPGSRAAAGALGGVLAKGVEKAIGRGAAHEAEKAGAKVAERAATKAEQNAASASKAAAEDIPKAAAKAPAHPVNQPERGISRTDAAKPKPRETAPPGAGGSQPGRPSAETRGKPTAERSDAPARAKPSEKSRRRGLDERLADTTKLARDRIKRIEKLEGEPLTDAEKATVREVVKRYEDAKRFDHDPTRRTDFSGSLYKPAPGSGQKARVDIGLPRGSRKADEKVANQLAGFTKGTPKNYTWHHNERLGQMELVKRTEHVKYPHHGMAAYWKQAGGWGNYK